MSDAIVAAIEAFGQQIVALEAAQQQQGREAKRTATIAALKADRAKAFMALEAAKAAGGGA
jgi:hypothetical protein